MTPLTGDAGFLGNEQLQLGQVCGQDAPAEVRPQGPARHRRHAARSADLASSLAQKYVADKSVVAILGPSTSGAVAASEHDVLRGRSRAHLAVGDRHVPHEGSPAKCGDAGFFRVVPDDGIQGPADARYMVDVLKVKKVVIVDSQEPYSVGLADAVQTYLKAKDVTTHRESVTNDTSDFSSIVTKVPSDADIVFFAHAAAAEGADLRAAAARAGQEGEAVQRRRLERPDKFKVPGSYVSNFAAPINLFPYNKPIIAGWQKDNPNSKLGSFGPPTYGAVQVALNAIKRACDAGKGSIKDRRAVVRNVKRIFIKNWILGGDFRFSTKTNDPLNGEFVHLPDPAGRLVQARLVGQGSDTGGDPISIGSPGNSAE